MEENLSSNQLQEMQAQMETLLRTSRILRSEFRSIISDDFTNGLKQLEDMLRLIQQFQEISGFVQQLSGLSDGVGASGGRFSADGGSNIFESLLNLGGH